VLYTRLIAHDRGKADERRGSLLELTGSLMSMIVLPYLGPAVAQKESSRAAPQPQTRTRAPSGDPLRDLQMRLTYRTVRVLMSIAVSPGASNRDIGMAAGIDDQGQISKLLSRMERLGLVHNSGAGQVSGAANAWALTAKGVEVQQLVDAGTSAGQLS
jgi:imidazolonepropionase-like amidohydrolase